MRIGTAKIMEITKKVYKKSTVKNIKSQGKIIITNQGKLRKKIVRNQIDIVVITIGINTNKRLKKRKLNMLLRILQHQKFNNNH